MPLIHVNEIFKSYGSNPVLKGADLVVEKGSIVAIIGRSGSGKSTLLRCINGLEKIDSGSITVDGVSIESCCGSAWALCFRATTSSRT